MLNIKNYIKQDTYLNILLVSIIIISIYFIFGLDYYMLLGLLAGVAFAAFALIELPNVIKSNAEFIILLLTGIFVYQFSDNFVFLTYFLVGFNMISMYFNSFIYASTAIKIRTNHATTINILILTTLTLSSALEKFRGSNRLILSEINLLIPLVILIVLAYGFLYKSFEDIKSNKRANDYKAIIISLSYFIIAFYLISQFIFKEVGSFTVFGPLLCGLIVYILDYIRSKYNINILLPFIIFFLFSYPYLVAGLLGITITYMCAILLTYVIKTKEIKLSNQSTVEILMPISFLFVSAEFRENAGLITRFNLANGVFFSNVLIGLCLMLLSIKYSDKLFNIIKVNEIEKAYPFIKMLFTIFILAFIIKYSFLDVLIGIILGAIIYILGQSYSKGISNTKDINLDRLVSKSTYSLLEFLGTIILMVLIRV